VDLSRGWFGQSVRPRWKASNIRSRIARISALNAFQTIRIVVAILCPLAIGAIALDGEFAIKPG